MIAKIEGNQVESTRRWLHALCLPADETLARQRVDLALTVGVDFCRQIMECVLPTQSAHVLCEHGLSACDYFSIQNDIADRPRILLL